MLIAYNRLWDSVYFTLSQRHCQRNHYLTDGLFCMATMLKAKQLEAVCFYGF